MKHKHSEGKTVKIVEAPSGDGPPKRARRKDEHSKTPDGRNSSPMPAYSPRTNSTGPYNSAGLAKSVSKARIVDFSYRDIENLNQLLDDDHFPPRYGLPVVKKRKGAMLPLRAVQQGPPSSPQGPGHAGAGPSPQTANNGKDINLFAVNGNAGKTQRLGDGIIVLKAKDETYAFRENLDDPMMHDKELQRYALNAEGVLVEKRDIKMVGDEIVERTVFHCNILRLDSNHLENIDNLLEITSIVLWKPLRNLAVLDLSLNRIEKLPDDLKLFPLHTLLLQGNKIAAIDEVKKLQALHGTLKKLNLNSNPIQTETQRYKYVILHHLPFLTCFDDVRVTMKDRERMNTFEHLFVKKEERGATVAFLPPLMPRSRSQIGVLGEYF